MSKNNSLFETTIGEFYDETFSKKPKEINCIFCFVCVIISNNFKNRYKINKLTKPTKENVKTQLNVYNLQLKRQVVCYCT